MSNLSRRAFLLDLARLGGTVGGLPLLAGCALGQPSTTPARVYRVGLLDTNQGASDNSIVGRPTFWERMTELGYAEGGNLAREERIATGDLAQLGDFAAELVRLPVEVIVAPNNATINAAAAATASIPIVMLGVPLDPVAQGWVESLARPGKNITGVVGAPPSVELKRLQLIVEATPGASKVAVLGGGADRLPASLEEAGRFLGVDLLPLPIESRESYEPAFERAVAEGAEALLVRLLAINANNASVIGRLAERHRIPAIASSQLFVAAGGLLAYDAVRSEIDRRGADYVDRILRGTRAADLPVEQLTRYRLMLNSRAARSLGLTLSQTFLAQVDEVVE